MKHICILTLLLAFFSAAFAIPAGTCELNGEWLYMQPSIDQPYYAISGSQVAVPNGEKLANSQDWRSGYRLKGEYHLCSYPYFFRLRWTDFGKFSEKSEASGFLYSTLLPPSDPFQTFGTANIEDTFRFWFLDLLVGVDICNSDCFYLSFCAGLQVNSLGLDEQVNYRTTTVDREINFRSRNRGVGPEMGFDFQYYIGNRLSFVGEAFFAYLITEKKRTFMCYRNTPMGGNNSQSTDENYTITTPAVDLRLGLNHKGNFKRRGNLPCQFCWDIEGGYEVISVRKGMNRTRFYDTLNNGLSFNNFMAYTMHGPYLRFGVRY